MLRITHIGFKNKVEPYYSRWGAYPIEIGMEVNSHAYDAAGFTVLLRNIYDEHAFTGVITEDTLLRVTDSPVNVTAVYLAISDSYLLNWDAQIADAYIITENDIPLAYSYTNSYNVLSPDFGVGLYRVVAVVEGFLSKPSTPTAIRRPAQPVALELFKFEHVFQISAELEDSYPQNIDYVVYEINEQPNILFEHPLKLTVELEDNSINSLHDYVEGYLNDQPNILFEHQLFAGMPLDDTSINYIYDYLQYSINDQPNILFEHQLNPGSEFEDTGVNNLYYWIGDNINGLSELNLAFEHSFINTFELEDGSVNAIGYVPDPSLGYFKEPAFEHLFDTLDPLNDQGVNNSDYQEIAGVFDENLVVDASFYDTAVDVSIYENEILSNLGAVMATHPVRASKPNSVFLDGVNDYITIEHNSDANSSTYTDMLEFEFVSLQDAGPNQLYSTVDKARPNSQGFNVSYYGNFNNPATYNKTISVQIADKYSGYGQYLYTLPAYFIPGGKYIIHTRYIQRIGAMSASELKVWVNGVELVYLTNTGNKGLETITIRDYSRSRVILGAYIDTAAVVNSGVDYYPNLYIGRYRRYTRPLPIVTIGSQADNFLNDQPIAPPTSIVTEEITSNSVRIGWTYPTNVTSINIYYSNDNFVTSTKIPNITGLNYTITGLTPSTIYKYRLSSNFEGSESNQSASITTTTLVATVMFRDLTINSNTLIYSHYRDSNSNNIANSLKNGLVVNTTVGDTGYTSGIISPDNSCVILNGTNQYIEYDTITFNSRTFTASIALQFVSLKAYQIIIGNYNFPSGTQFEIEFDNSSKKFRILLYTNNDAAIGLANDTAINFALNTSYLLEFSWDQPSQTFKFYLNGVNQAVSKSEGSEILSTLVVRNDLTNRMRVGAYNHSGSINSGISGYFPNIKVLRTRYNQESTGATQAMNNYNTLFS